MYERITNAIAFALAEYALIAFPVGIFVTLDAAQSRDWNKTWNSPEWAIVILFLVLRVVFLHFMSVHKVGKELGKELNEPVLLLFFLSLFCVSIVATVNAWASLVCNTPGAIALRLIILILVSLVFFASVGGGYYNSGNN